MIDFSLTEEQLLLQRTAREFAQKEVKPIAEEYDKKQDPEQSVIPLDSELFKKADKLGFTKMIWPNEYGGAGLGELDLVIALEEFAAADVGFAVQMNSLNTIAMFTIPFGGEEVRNKFRELVDAKGLVVGTAAFNERDAGGADYMCTISDPKLGIKTHARREGDYFVIKGSKHAFITGIQQASFHNVLARTDLTKPQTEAASWFFVPADTPGVSVGKTTDKICWRTVPHGEVFFDDVRIPKEYELEPKGKALEFPPAFTVGLVAASTFSVGIARAAFEYAVDYAKKRVTWGQPIINHQAVAVMLADMQMEIEAARYMVWHTAWLNDFNARSGRPGAYHTGGSMQKVFATEMAVRVVEKAINVVASYALTKDYPLEKYLREALAGPITCWPNNIHRLQIADAL